MILKSLKNKSELRITAIYVALGLLWITFSTGSLYYLFEFFGLSEETVYWIEGAKGFFYVLLTGLLLFSLIRRSNAKLIKSKEQFENIFISHPNPIWIFEVDTYKILQVNQAAVEIYGYTEDEFSKMTLLDIRPNEDAEAFKTNINRLNTSISDKGVWRHKKKNGEIFFVNIYSHGVEYDGKKCRAAMSLDVNEKILAQKEILKLNESLSEKEVELAERLQEKINFNNALNNSAIVSVTDLKGNIIEVNEKFCELSKYSRDELIGHNHRITNSGHHSKAFWKEMWLTVSNGQSWRAEVKNKAKDGRYYWVDTTINPIKNPKGKIYQYMSVRYDISNKKELEEKQNKLVQDLTKYTHLTSHFLRAPLARMLGLVNLVHKEKELKRILELVERLEITSLEMDEVITEMNEVLNRNTYNNIINKSRNIQVQPPKEEVVIKK